MSRHLGPAQTLALVEDLRDTVRELKARADKITEEFRTRTAKEALRHQSALSALNDEWTRTSSAAEAALAQGKQRGIERHQALKRRIDEAFQASKEQAIKRVEGKTGSRRYEMQRKTLQAERDREAGIAAANNEAQDLRTELATVEQELAAAERSAQLAFRGYPRLKRAFLSAYNDAHAPSGIDRRELLSRAKAETTDGQKAMAELKGLFLLRTFRFVWIWVIFAIAIFPGILLLLGGSVTAIDTRRGEYAAAAASGALLLALLLRVVAFRASKSKAAAIAAHLSQARRAHDACLETIQTHLEAETTRLGTAYKQTLAQVESELHRVHAHASEDRVASRMRSDQKAVHAAARNDRLNTTRLSRLERDHSELLAQAKAQHETQAAALIESNRMQEESRKEQYQASLTGLITEWNDRLRPLFQTLGDETAAAERISPPWTDPHWEEWKPPTKFEGLTKFAIANVDVAKLSGGLPIDKRLILPGPEQFSTAVSCAYPNGGSVLFETAETGHNTAVESLNNIILRLLAATPPGRLNFTVIDPVGLGQNFAGVMHLADFEEQLINNRIWTQSGQIEQKLADLNEHMEKVIQMYLRNEYETIAEYNEQAGVIAEKYHFLVVADFPANFTDVAARRLMSIAASGAKCGVYMLLHWDRRQPVPQDFLPDELRKGCFTLVSKGKDWLVSGKPIPGIELVLDGPPTPELAISLINEIGLASRDSSRVEVPFENVAPAAAQIWSETTTSELRVAIGRTGATKLQYLELGKGTRQHGLVAGKTGSGKSTLFHVIITNLSLWCSPEQVEFYLVDFKKGVEFKGYGSNRLPHARVVAIESDREFALSVLQRVDEELKRRGDLFRKLGVQDLPGFQRAGGGQLPRSLLIIDEFQEFFVEDDKIAQTASLLLDRIVRQGRAFGIHVLLGSQTLGGAYTVARTTLGQMVIRIALQCNEADAYLIMDDTNPAPRLLSRPGEGIYNDSAGALEGNSPFQVVWLPDSVRDSYLKKIRAYADQTGKSYPAPVVFEGNAPADIRENLALRETLASSPSRLPTAPRMWLGAPNSIKGPTEVVFHRQSGNNLLMVGQQEEAMLSLLCIGMVSIAAQHPRGAARILVCDSSPPGSPARNYLERTGAALGQEVRFVKPGELGEVLQSIVTELKGRDEALESTELPAIFLFINGIQRFAKLRYEEDFSFASGDEGAPPNPAMLLNQLVTESTRLGFHAIITCDTYNNVNRFMSRKALSEFEMRVLFQMSANDSASLIDSPKASTLGLHRALFYNEQEGYLETFRPYALPDGGWLDEVEERLRTKATAP